MIYEIERPGVEVTPFIPSPTSLALEISRTVRGIQRPNEQPGEYGIDLVDSKVLEVNYTEKNSRELRLPFEYQGHLTSISMNIETLLTEVRTARRIGDQTRIIRLDVEENLEDAKQIGITSTIHKSDPEHSADEQFLNDALQRVKTELTTALNPSPQVIVFDDAAGI